MSYVDALTGKTRAELELLTYDELLRLYHSTRAEERTTKAVEEMKLIGSVLGQRYNTQFAEAIESVALSRASRSFVVAGANTNLRALKFRVKRWCEWEDDEDETEALTVMDQAGEMVPAADFYEYLRQYFGEYCTLIRALAEHVDGIDYVGEMSDDLWNCFNEARRNLEERGHFGPTPWPLHRLFRDMDPPVEIILAQEARNLEREAGLARMVWARRAKAADPLRIVVSFLGGRVGAEQVEFLPRDELPEAMRRLVDSYNSIDQDRYWDADVWLYCGAEDQIPVWSCDVPVGGQAFGGFSEKRQHAQWSVYWEGETESDTDDELMGDYSVDWSSSDSEEYFSASSEDEG